MGLGVYAGMEMIRVPGATGLYDTNYEGKAQAALDALEQHDLVYVHVEATDEAGHARDLDLKIKCIEYLDDRIVRPLLAGIEERGIEARWRCCPITRLLWRPGRTPAIRFRWPSGGPAPRPTVFWGTTRSR